jgi:GPI-anchor transamidase subunit S
VHWNVRAAAEAYLEPFLDALRRLSNFTVKSQWKYQITMDHSNKQMPDNSVLQRHYSISEEHLPYVITALEKRLGNSISNHPLLHLVAYVPACPNAPLHIYQRSGQRASSNNVDAFISPKWGSVIIVNPSNATCLDYLSEREDHVMVEVNAHEVMKTALYQLRQLFELERETPITSASIVPLQSIVPRAWEVDSYQRTGAIHLVHSAQSTLKSLISLLDDINYIVIDDDVGQAVNDAYDHILLAKQCLLDNELDTCVDYARAAFVAAERAFFDPSLLALLYFPDEQKYAIYIPLFLPIMIPVVLSINSIRKYLMHKGGATKEKAE